MSKAEELTIGSASQKAYREALADTERKIAGIMNDTATQQVTFTREEYTFLFRCLLAENNRLNRNVVDGMATEAHWKNFIDLVNAVLPKLTALTETK